MARCQVRWIFLAYSIFQLAIFTACGGSLSTPPPPPPPPAVTVAIHPQWASVVAGSQQQQFAASVTGDPSNLGATWAVDGVGGGNAATGSISAAGIYLPPAAAGTHTVTATSLKDSSKSASATVGVTDLTGVFTYHNNLARDGVNA